MVSDTRPSWPPEPTHYRPPLGRLMLARETVDRAAHHRSDSAWLARAWADPGTRVLTVWDGQALVRFGEPEASLVLLPSAQAPEGLRSFLGVDGDGRAYFSVLAPLPEPSDGAEPAGLRGAGALLGDRDAGLFTHAVALANWHATHTHCPRCGTPTDPIQSGHARRCPHDGSEHFPRTDPAVIMLVHDGGDRALLGRGPQWPAGRFSTLAGFVEPGESLEAAVAREVFEEVGVVVHDVRYVGSQPWPFPASLMLGFIARSASGAAITVDPVELVEAGWFTRDEVRRALDWTDDFAAADESGEHRLRAIPARLSISRYLIDRWLAGEV